MGKALYIAEKPSVAEQFAKVLKVSGSGHDGYMESQDSIVTWCLGHLITMSYPDAYDPRLKRWSLDTLPFIPDSFRYEVIETSKKQYEIVARQLNRQDVDVIYVCTDSGREGEYIYRLVEQMAGVHGKKRLRVWIDSQTEEEIRKGIRTAKDLSAYDNLASAAYLRAREDYLMGINFSRLLTLKYGNIISSFMNTKRTVISVGRVMTCVQGMVVRREREIRDFVPTSFYRVTALLDCRGNDLETEWRAVPGSRYEGQPCLYKDNGFLKKEKAQELVQYLSGQGDPVMKLAHRQTRQEKKNPPLLFNLAELQNECSRRFRLSPDQTLKITQELYEKKMVTYPRTDARVLSSAVAKEIASNLNGLKKLPKLGVYADKILESGGYKGITRSRYVNDKAISDHYAIIPTGQGTGQSGRLSAQAAKVYDVIVRRFLSIFFPAAVYEKYSLEFICREEHFFASFRVLKDPGYLVISDPAHAFAGKGSAGKDSEDAGNAGEAGGTFDDPGGPGKTKAESRPEGGDSEEEEAAAEDEQTAAADDTLMDVISRLRGGSVLPVIKFTIKEGQTAPPKRYTSGSMILAMENAGQLIEDEELREQIRGSGIGTSATRAEILKKLVTNGYLALNQKTQVITPTLLGELIYDTVDCSVRQLLNPELTANWEKGLTAVADGVISEDEYMKTIVRFITRYTADVKNENQARYQLPDKFAAVKAYYPDRKQPSGRKYYRKKKSTQRKS